MATSTVGLLADIRGRLRKRAEMPDTIFGFLVDNEAYCIWVSGGTISVDAWSYLPPNRSITISLSAETLRAIMAGRTSPTAAYLSGRLKVDGSLTIARRLSELF